MRRYGIGLAVVAFAVGAPWALAAQDDVTVNTTAVGWWSSRPTALPQDDGGFEVAAGPNGDPQSVAALRMSIPLAEVTKLEVALDEASGFGHELGALKLCRTFAPWVPANPGAWDARPTEDCSASTTLTRTGDGLWLGEASALARSGGEVSLMVVPVYNSPVEVGPGMIVTIAGGSFSATGTNPTSTSGPGPSTGPSFTPTSDFGSGVDFPPVATGSFGSPSFGGPEPVDPTEDPTDPVSPTPAGDDDFALDPIQSSSGSSRPWIRLVLLVPLSLGFGLGSVRLRQMVNGQWEPGDGEGGRLDILMGLFRP